MLLLMLIFVVRDYPAGAKLILLFEIQLVNIIYFLN